MSDDAKETTARVRSVRIVERRATSLVVAKRVDRARWGIEMTPKGTSLLRGIEMTSRGTSLLRLLRRVDGRPRNERDTGRRHAFPPTQTVGAEPARAVRHRRLPRRGGGFRRLRRGRRRRPVFSLAARRRPFAADDRVRALHERLVLLERRRGGPLRVISLLAAVLSPSLASALRATRPRRPRPRRRPPRPPAPSTALPSAPSTAPSPAAAAAAAASRCSLCFFFFPRFSRAAAREVRFANPCRR